MATSSQISSALSISGTFNLITGAAVITDTTAWGTLSIQSPNTVAFLLYIQDPFGRNFYKNAGYDAANFAAPDFTEFAGNSYSFTLPTDVTGAYITGVYTVNIKVQVNQLGVLTNAATTLTQNVSPCCANICAKVSPIVTYVPVAVGVTDNTNYGANISVANTLTLYPPPQSGEGSQTATFTGSPSTIYFTPPMGQNPYTGTWSWSLSSILTYIDPITGASTTCKIVGQGSFDVVQSPICTVLCFLQKYEQATAYSRTQTESEAGRMNYILAQAQGYLAMMQGGMTCGWSITTLNAIADKIYSLIGADKDCPCSCNQTASQQIISGVSGGGTPGTNGLSFRQGTGVPSAGLGIVGDSYLNNANGNVYLKTGASTWAYEFNILGATGTAGQSGANGACVLYNDLTSTPNTVGTTQTLKQYSLPANTVTTSGSEIRIRCNFSGVAPALDVLGQIQIGAVLLAQAQINIPVGTTIDAWVFDLTISKTSVGNATVVGMVYPVVNASTLGTGTNIILPTAIAVDWTIAQNITVNVTAGATSGCTCSQLEVVLYQFGITAPTVTIGGQYANDTDAAAGGIPLNGFYINSATGALTQRLT